MVVPGLSFSERMNSSGMMSLTVDAIFWILSTSMVSVALAAGEDATIMASNVIEQQSLKFIGEDHAYILL